MPIKASIIIPTYNTARYIREAVDSALAQTCSGLEVIVVDDGSADDTKTILQPYVSEKKINYVYQPNRGLAAARNTGIKQAKGEYIALLDADDIFLPGKIEAQIAFLEAHPECDVCYCDIYHFWDEEPTKLLKLNYRYYSGDEVLPNLIKRHFIAPLTMLVRRSVFERYGLFDEAFRRSEDLEFLVRITSGGVRICFLNAILGKLRLRRTNNLQGFSSQPQVKLTGLKVFEKLNYKLSLKEKKRLKMKKYLALYRLKVGLAYLENSDKKNAKPFVQRAFKDFYGGAILGYLVWFFIALTPIRFLALLMRRYHLKRQTTSLQPA